MSDYPQGPIEDRSERREQRRGSSGALFAVALIVLGAASLVGNLGIATVNWAEAARYWPVLLILIGLDLMIGRRSMLGSGVMAVVTVAALLGVFWLSSQVPVGTSPPAQVTMLFPPVKPVSGNIEEKLGGVKKLEVTIELSQMALKLGSLDDSSLAAQGDWSTAEGLKPEISYEVQDDTGVLTIHQPDSNGIPPFAVDSQMKLNLPSGIPIELNVNNDLGAVTLDLSGLDVTALDVNASSGNQTITLPEAGQMQTVKVHGDLGSVLVKAPDMATLNMDTLDVSSSSGNLTVALPGTGTIGDLSVKGDLGAVKVTIPDDATLEIGPADFESSSGNLAVALPAHGKAGVVTIKCDLGSVTLSIPGTSNTLTVEQLDVNASSGNVNVTLPGGKGDYPADIQNDLGSVTVAFPSTLEVNLSIDAGFTKPTISSDRLKASGGSDWKTAGYDTGDHRALVTIQASSGRIEVKDN